MVFLEVSTASHFQSTQWYFWLELFSASWQYFMVNIFFPLEPFAVLCHRFHVTSLCWYRSRIFLITPKGLSGYLQEICHGVRVQDGEQLGMLQVHNQKALSSVTTETSRQICPSLNHSGSMGLFVEAHCSYFSEPNQVRVVLLPALPTLFSAHLLLIQDMKFFSPQGEALLFRKCIIVLFVCLF